MVWFIKYFHNKGARWLDSHRDFQCGRHVCGDWILLTVNRDIWQWRVICETLFTLFYLPVSTQIKLICSVQHAEHEHIYTYNVPATWDLFTLTVVSVIPRCFHCKQTRGSHVDHTWVTAAVNHDCEPGVRHRVCQVFCPISGRVALVVVW